MREPHSSHTAATQQPQPYSHTAIFTVTAKQQQPCGSIESSSDHRVGSYAPTISPTQAQPSSPLHYTTCCLSALRCSLTDPPGLAGMLGCLAWVVCGCCWLLYHYHYHYHYHVQSINQSIVQMSTYSTQRGTAPRSLSRVGSRTMPLGGMGGRRAHRPLLRGNCSAAPSTRFVDHGSLLQQHIAERHERSHGD
jgi:hypothetical protein